MKCRGNATCLLGSSLSAESTLFKNIVQHRTPVVLMLDNDMKTKTHAIARSLSFYDIDVWIASHEGFHDPGEMNFSDVERCVENAKLWSWNSFFAQKLNSLGSCSLRI